ncbi:MULTISPECIES: hypothetical protein [Bradyrhizobium]|nr:hypothetical protein [Bradyrhizobium elkanii]
MMLDDEDTPGSTSRPASATESFVVADRMGAVAFVELNTDGAPIGLALA